MSSENTHLLHLRSDHLKAVSGTGVLQAAHTADQIEGVWVESSVFEVGVVDVNGHDVSDYEAASGWFGREIDNLMQFAFEAHGRLSDAGRSHGLRNYRFEFRQLELVDRSVVLAASRVHVLAQIIGHDADDEFFGLANVAQRIFRFAVRL